ncbi:uncharacterized protein [Musca autumnalis]|uniref:uncharacterized protein n=1 Tax=Musca autumnalis TaxID=221902 RepID=UPI003CECD454
MKTIIIVSLLGLYCLGQGEALLPMNSFLIEMKSVDVATSNADLLNLIDFGVNRVERGLFGMSGKIILNFDVVEGDSNEVEMKVFYSANGKGNYGMTPIHLGRQHVFNILNTIYKDGAMENLKDCSNLPQFKDKFDPPLVKDTYYMDKCQFKDDGFPNHAYEGFYKMAIIGYGVVDWKVDLVFKLEID